MEVFQALKFVGLCVEINNNILLFTSQLLIPRTGGSVG